MHGLTDFIARTGPPFILSLFASWSALMGRYWPLRRPFSTRQSSTISIMVITLTASASTIAAFILPRLIGAIPPYLAGLAPPALIVVPSLANRNRDQFKGASNISAVIRASLTLSVAILLGNLDRLLVDQRDKFGQDRARIALQKSNTRSRVEEFYRRLEERQQSSRLKRLKGDSPDLSAYFNSFTASFDRIDESSDREERERQILIARLAVESLLKVAYDLRAESLVEAVWPLPTQIRSPGRKTEVRQKTP